MVVEELPPPGAVGPPQVPHVAQAGNRIVDAQALFPGEFPHQRAGGVPAVRADPRRELAAHDEADLDVVVRAGPGQPGLIAEHLDHHRVVPVVARLVQLAQPGDDRLPGGQPQPAVPGRLDRHGIGPQVVVAEGQAVPRVGREPPDELRVVVHLDGRAEHRRVPDPGVGPLAHVPGRPQHEAGHQMFPTPGV